MDAETKQQKTAVKHNRSVARYVVVLAVFFVLLGLVLLWYVLTTSASGESQTAIISRTEWGARPPKSRANMTSPTPSVIIHHSLVPDLCLNRSQCEAYVRAIQDFHMDTRGWDDIGYNFLIGGNGDVFEGRGWDVTGAHAGPNWNYRSLGICFIGDFTNKLPPEKAVQAGKRLIKLSIETNKLMTNYTLYGHRQVLPRECPGDEFYSFITTWDHWTPRNYTAE